MWIFQFSKKFLMFLILTTLNYWGDLLACEYQNNETLSTAF